MKRCTATEARKNMGNIIERAYHSGEPVIVERRKKPMVAIVPLESNEDMSTGKGFPLPTFRLGKIEGNLSRREIYEEHSNVFLPNRLAPMRQNGWQRSFCINLSFYLPITIQD